MLHSPLWYFESNPIGHTLNRFSRDIDVIDFTLPMALRSLFTRFCSLLSVFVIIASSTPIFIGVLAAVLIVFLLFLYIYLPTSRQLRRLESATLSPLFSHIAETISGLLKLVKFLIYSRLYAHMVANRLK